MIQNLKMLNRFSLISFGFSFMLLFSFKAEAESMIPDFSARYIFETDQFDFEGIRQLKTFADKRVFSFEDRARLIKAEFYSEFIDADEIKSLSYDANFRFTFFRRFTNFDFDWETKKLTSTGQYDWQATLMEAPVYDPLNVQVELRKRLMLGETEFSLQLPEIKTGELVENTYAIKGETIFTLEGKEYPCVILERVRSQDNRITTYTMAKDLNYLIFKITDNDPDGDIALTIKQLLSFG